MTTDFYAELCHVLEFIRVVPDLCSLNSAVGESRSLLQYLHNTSLRVNTFWPSP